MTEHPNDDEHQSAREVLACALKALREKAGRTLAELSDDTGYDRSYLNRLENGERLPKKSEVMEDLDSFYGTGNLLRRLWKMAREEVIADRYKRFVHYEAGAVIMHKYMMGIPGLLQTEDYARVVLTSTANRWSPDELEEQVAARIGRQELLRRTPAPSVRVILDEYALRRATPDPEVWREQLAHLVESAARPGIVLQVLPFASGVHDLMGGSLSLLWQADGTGVAYLEGNKSGQLFDDPEEVAQFRLSYDQLRDSALSPTASVDYLNTFLKGRTP